MTPLAAVRRALRRRTDPAAPAPVLPPGARPLFADAGEVKAKLGAAGYEATDATVGAVLRADRTGRALLVEGSPGVGKSALAVALAQASGAHLVRLPCYPGLDEAKALYAWDHPKQVLRLAGRQPGASVFTEEFLLARPLLAALRGDGPTVLLVDDLDRAEVEFDALLLEVLADWAVTIPELGTLAARRRPLTILTSTGRRELSDALRRRCHYLHLPPPTAAIEQAILARRLPDAHRRLARSLVHLAASGADPWRDTLVAAAGTGPALGPVAAGRLAAYQRRRSLAHPGHPGGLAGHTTAFVDALRERGLACGATDLVDAVRALTLVDLADRPQVRATLSATLVHHGRELPAFHTMFDLWFPLAPAEPDPGGTGGEGDAVRALAEGGTDAVRQLAADLVGRHGGYRSANGDSFSALATEQAADLPELEGNLARALAQALPGTDLDAQLARQLARVRVQELRGAITTEVNRRVAELRGTDTVARYAVPEVAGPAYDPDADDTTPHDPSAQDPSAQDPTGQAAVRRAVAELGRALATREAAARRKARAGEVDLRRTLRAAMSTGGVPITLVRRRRHPSKPQLLVVCDMSSSVAGFTYFTLLLVQALRDAFSKVRVFVFVDTLDEVTDLLTPGAPAREVYRAIRAHAAVAFGAKTDYGRALADLEDGYPGAVTSKTSLLVLGDARANYSDPRADVLGRLAAAARHAHWLNPEEAHLWGTGDSAAPEYAALVPMHECRTIDQLAAVIADELR